MNTKNDFRPASDLPTPEDLETLDLNNLWALISNDTPDDTPESTLADGVPELSDVRYWVATSYPQADDSDISTAARNLHALLAARDDDLWAIIDGEVCEFSHVEDYGYLPLAATSHGPNALEYYLAEDSESAGEKAREYWKDMAENDPREFAAIIGEETLIGWALGHSSGHAGCSSLEEWLDLVATVPEEEFASYDGEEREVTGSSSALRDELGFTPTVAYRHN